MSENFESSLSIFSSSTSKRAAVACQNCLADLAVLAVSAVSSVGTLRRGLSSFGSFGSFLGAHSPAGSQQFWQIWQFLQFSPGTSVRAVLQFCSFGRKSASSFMCSKLYSHEDSGGEQFCSFGSFSLEQFHILKTVFSYTPHVGARRGRGLVACAAAYCSYSILYSSRYL